MLIKKLEFIDFLTVTFIVEVISIIIIRDKIAVCIKSDLRI